MPAESAGSPVPKIMSLARGHISPRGKGLWEEAQMRLLRSTRFVAILAVGVMAASACAQAPTRPVNSGNRSTMRSAIDYLKTQQQADGGFEVAGFPGFETPDAIAAIASEGNVSITSRLKTDCIDAESCPKQDPTSEWSIAAAGVRVKDIKNAAGKSPLDAVDDYAESPTLSAGQAAKLIVLVTEPLGFDPLAFDPAGDGNPINLLGKLVSAYNPDGTFGPAGSFNVTLYSTLAWSLVYGEVPNKTLAALKYTQRADGGWNYLGSSTGNTASDIDTTALALQALVASLPTDRDVWSNKPLDSNQLDSNQKAVAKALGFLASKVQPNGGFGTATSQDPNSTALAILAIRAVGFNPAQPCWRNASLPSSKGTAYSDPSAWLRSQQLPTGRIQSPNDSFGVNTFATAQTVQALALSWFPIVEHPLVKCTSENLQP